MPKAGWRAPPIAAPSIAPGVAPCRYPATGVRGDSDQPSARKIRVEQRESSSISLAYVGSEPTRMRIQGGGAGGLWYSQVRGSFRVQTIRARGGSKCAWLGELSGRQRLTATACRVPTPACRLSQPCLVAPTLFNFSQLECVC